MCVVVSSYLTVGLQVNLSISRSPATPVTYVPVQLETHAG